MAHLQSRQRDERYNSPNAEHVYRRNSDGQILLRGPEVLRVPCRNQRKGTGNHYCDDPVYYVTVEAVGLLRPVRSLAAIFLAVSLVANGQDVRSWGNLDSIAAGQALEVRKLTGGSVRGTYAAHSEQSIDLSNNQQLVSIPRVQISDIRLRPKTRNPIWIGLGVGAAAGAAIGAGIGSGVSNESGGDFSNLTPLVIGVCAGVGALVGFGIGLSVAHRHTLIYRAK